LRKQLRAILMVVFGGGHDRSLESEIEDLCRGDVPSDVEKGSAGVAR